MTDEEKAEEYVNSNGFCSYYNNIDSCEANEEIRQAYLDGLAEGRKARALEEKQRGQNVIPFQCTLPNNFQLCNAFENGLCFSECGTCNTSNAQQQVQTDSEKDDRLVGG